MNLLIDEEDPKQCKTVLSEINAFSSAEYYYRDLNNIRKFILEFEFEFEFEETENVLTLLQKE